MTTNNYAEVARDLPRRAALIGPQRSVSCDVPTDLMERYLEALHAHEWTDTERPE